MKHTVVAAVVLVLSVPLAGCVVAGTSRGGGSGLFVLFLPAMLIGLALVIGRTGRRRTARHAAARPGLDVSSGLLRAELSVIADDVLRLEPQVALRPDARDDFEAATHRYRVAQAALEDTGAPVDLLRVQRVVDEATWLMSRVRAALDGRPLPGPPSTLQAAGPRGEPAIVLEGDQQPTYAGTGTSFSAGWFGIGGGLFTGLLLGSMIDEPSWDPHDDDPYGAGDLER